MRVEGIEKVHAGDAATGTRAAALAIQCERQAYINPVRRRRSKHPVRVHVRGVYIGCVIRVRDGSRDHHPIRLVVVGLGRRAGREVVRVLAEGFVESVIALREAVEGKRSAARVPPAEILCLHCPAGTGCDVVEHDRHVRYSVFLIIRVLAWSVGIGVKDDVAGNHSDVLAGCRAKRRRPTRIALFTRHRVQYAIATDHWGAIVVAGVAGRRRSRFLAGLAKDRIEIAVTAFPVRAVEVTVRRFAGVVADLAGCRVDHAIATNRRRAIAVAGRGRCRRSRLLAGLACGRIDVAVTAGHSRAIGIAGRRLDATLFAILHHRIDDAIAAHDERTIGVAASRVAGVVAFLSRRRVGHTIPTNRRRAIAVAGRAGRRRCRLLAGLARGRIDVAVTAGNSRAIGVTGRRLDAPVVASFAGSGVRDSVATNGRGAIGIAGRRLAAVVTGLTQRDIGVAVAAEGPGSTDPGREALLGVVSGPGIRVETSGVWHVEKRIGVRFPGLGACTLDAVFLGAGLCDGDDVIAVIGAAVSLI